MKNLFEMIYSEGIRRTVPEKYADAFETFMKEWDIHYKKVLESHIPNVCLFRVYDIYVAGSITAVMNVVDAHLKPLYEEFAEELKKQD